MSFPFLLVCFLLYWFCFINDACSFSVIFSSNVSVWLLPTGVWKQIRWKGINTHVTYVYIQIHFIWYDLSRSNISTLQGLWYTDIDISTLWRSTQTEITWYEKIKEDTVEHLLWGHPFAPEKWPFKRGGLSSGVEFNTFMFRFTLSDGLCIGVDLSSRWPLKKDFTVSEMKISVRECLPVPSWASQHLTQHHASYFWKKLYKSLHKSYSLFPAFSRREIYQILLRSQWTPKRNRLPKPSEMNQKWNFI